MTGADCADLGSAGPNMERDRIALQKRIWLNTCINHLTNVGRREEVTGASQNRVSNNNESNHASEVINFLRVSGCHS
jgi:hypothetical protein